MVDTVTDNMVGYSEKKKKKKNKANRIEECVDSEVCFSLLFLCTFFFVSV